MTSFEPYGVRHFLRRMDPEGASELRRRFVTLRNGELLPTGASADVDRIRLDELLVYRTLVLRRGPTASRPPSAYRLAWTGRYYEVWQRPATSVNAIVEHLSLGTGLQAGAVARCADVLRLARLARGGSLMAAVRPLTVEATSSPSAGEVVTSVELPASGVYTAWLRGDFFGRASVSVDGAPLGSKRHDLNWPDLYTPLGRRMLSAGAHLVRLRYDVGGWRPGSRGTPYSFGPLVLSPQDLREPVLDVPPARARMLCGRRLDWVEAVRSARNS